MEKRRFLFLSALEILILFASQTVYCDDNQDRWGPVTSGPFYTGTAEVEPLGSDFIEPWWFDSMRPGQNTVMQSMLQRFTVGLGRGWDFSLSIPLQYNSVAGENAFAPGDTTLWFKREIIKDANPLSFWAHPAISVEALFVLPTGQYQNLNPALKGADQTGNGTFDESLQLVFRKRFKPFALYAQVGDYVSNPNSVPAGFGFDNGLIATPHPLTLVNGNLINYSAALEHILNEKWGAGYVLELTGQTQGNQSLFSGAANAPAWSYLWGSTSLEITWPNQDDYAVTWGAGMTFPIQQINYPRAYAPMATVTFNFMGNKGYRGQNN